MRWRVWVVLGVLAGCEGGERPSVTQRGMVCEDGVCCDAALTVISGTIGDDLIKGGPPSECILGLEGDDTVKAGPGADVVLGGPGADQLHGSAFDDAISGGPGSDTLVGSAGDDTLAGGLGDDDLRGDAGADHLIGGPGDDFLRSGSGPDVIVPGSGRDETRAGAHDDVIEIHHVCEIESGEIIDGGPGTDTLRAPLSLAQLEAQGVTITSIENFEQVFASDDSDCVPTRPPSNMGPGGICAAYSKTAAVIQAEVASVEYTFDDFLGPREAVTLTGVVTHFGQPQPAEIVLRTARGPVPGTDDLVMVSGETPPPYLLGRTYLLFLHGSIWHSSPVRLDYSWRLESVDGTDVIVNAEGLVLDSKRGFVRDDDDLLATVFEPNFDWPNWNAPHPVAPDAANLSFDDAMTLAEFLSITAATAANCPSAFGLGMFFEYPHGTHGWNQAVTGAVPGAVEPCGPNVVDPVTDEIVLCDE